MRRRQRSLRDPHLAALRRVRGRLRRPVLRPQPELRPEHLLRPQPNYWYNRRDNDDRNRDEARRQQRFDRPENDVVCDRRTQVCYKDKEIDASETREKFGKDAARRVDRVRDRYDNNDLFLPRKNTVCDRDDRTCYQNGDPNRKQTREFFGNKAASASRTTATGDRVAALTRALTPPAVLPPPAGSVFDRPHGRRPPPRRRDLARGP
jgi:hypothetical protein